MTLPNHPELDLPPCDAASPEAAIRFHIQRLGDDALRPVVIGILTRTQIFGTVSSMAATFDAMEARGEISRTSSGAYVLGRHAAAAEDLVLTSTDPLFGQARISCSPAPIRCSGRQVCSDDTHG